jgi:hypothetical protein
MAKITSRSETKDECPKGGGHQSTSASERGKDGRYTYWSYCEKCKVMLSTPHY